MRNITAFAGGEFVGQATKNYASEFLINIGDPLVSRLDDNDPIAHTNFDRNP